MCTFWERYRKSPLLEEDFAKFSEGLNVPMAPPSLKGKVEDYARKNLLWNSPRPDE